VEGAKSGKITGSGYTDENGQFKDTLRTVRAQTYSKWHQVITGGGYDIGHYFIIFDSALINKTTAP